MANKNIDAMIEELKQSYSVSLEFPGNWVNVDKKGLYISVTDIHLNWYGVDDDFMENLLLEVDFEYKANKANKASVVLTSEKELRFELAEGYINDFEDIGKILQIIGKHLSKIELRA